MAETSVVEANGNSKTASGSLFQGKQFWLSKNIPQRSRFKEDIKQNGGVIRPLEKDAEIKLVDHVRKNLPVDTFSYRFVEDSVRTGRLQNLENYRAGPSASRPVGATNIPSRGYKVPYTLEDDQFLWDWMQPYENDPNAQISGNRIYQELALVNPRHPYQSWRDRYLKRIRGRPRPGGGIPQSTAPYATQENNQRAPTSTPTPTAAAAVASSRQRSPQGPRTAVRTPDVRKRKRTPSPHNSDDTDSSGGDIPARKRRAAGSPGSDAKTPTPEVSQQNQEIPSRSKPPPPQTVIPIFDEEITNKRNTEKGKARERAPEKTAEQEPEREPEPEREKTPEQPLEDKAEQNPRSPSPANEDYEPEPIDPNFLELPFLPSTPGSSEPEEQPEQDIDAWIDNRLSTGIAKSEDQIIEALRCTSMDPQLADQVLKHLVAGYGIPKNVAGVWTAEDDKCIEGRDTRGIERVLEKHGSEFFNSRWQYLDMARTAGLEKDQEEGITEL